jgi:hypothetical protein
MLWRSTTSKEKPYSLCWTERQTTKNFNHLITKLKFFSNHCSPIFEIALIYGRFPGFALCPSDKMGMGTWLNVSDRGKPVPMSFCPPQISSGLTRDQSWASAVTGRRLIAWAMGLKRRKLTWIIVKDSVLTAQYTNKVSAIKPQIINTTINITCSENLKKHKNSVCWQNVEFLNIKTSGG